MAVVPVYQEKQARIFVLQVGQGEKSKSLIVIPGLTNLDVSYCLSKRMMLKIYAGRTWLTGTTSASHAEDFRFKLQHLQLKRSDDVKDLYTMPLSVIVGNIDLDIPRISIIH